MRFRYLKESLKDATGKISSSRYQSFLIMALIYGMVGSYLLKNDFNNFEIILGMLLSHHLILLGLKNNKEKDDSNRGKDIRKEESN